MFEKLKGMVIVYFDLFLCVFMAPKIITRSFAIKLSNMLLRTRIFNIFATLTPIQVVHLIILKFSYAFCFVFWPVSNQQNGTDFCMKLDNIITNFRKSRLCRFVVLILFYCTFIIEIGEKSTMTGVTFESHWRVFCLFIQPV